MQISTRCSVAVHCLVFICEAQRLGETPVAARGGAEEGPASRTGEAHGEAGDAGTGPGVAVPARTAASAARVPAAAGPFRVTSTLLSQSTGTNAASIRAAMSALRRAGIIDVARGTGGATLARRPEDVTLLDVYRAVEPTSLEDAIGIHRCEGRACPVARNIHGVLADAYRPVADAMARAMSGVSLADMLADYRRRIEAEVPATS